jgi:hypothetical protein
MEIGQYKKRNFSNLVWNDFSLTKLENLGPNLLIEVLYKRKKFYTIFHASSYLTLFPIRDMDTILSSYTGYLYINEHISPNRHLISRIYDINIRDQKFIDIYIETLFDQEADILDQNHSNMMPTLYENRTFTLCRTD